jgi:hypothetical protein
MSFLLDTNIFIPLEPTAAIDFSSDSPAAIDPHRLAQTANITLWVGEPRRGRLRNLLRKIR